MTERGTLTGQRVGAANVRTTIRQGASFARGSLVDGFIDDKDCETLYRKWSTKWQEPEQHRGGEVAITCEMIRDVPEAEFKKVMGAALGKRIRAVAMAHAVV
jgi:hypothetical protein